jgi:pectate lyase
MIVASVHRAMKSSGLLAASALSIAMFSIQPAQALPVIPGAAGFGIETPAGRGGTVYRVTNLNASGAGSLKACIDGTSARTCVFEVSGTIRITSDLLIRNSKITIAGQTAPSPGIMLRGAALKIQASDVLVQHIRVRAGDDSNGPDPENRDSLKIEGSSSKPVRNVVIDHCSFSWAIDETVSVWGPHDNITFSNNIFSEPLNESIHPKDSGSGYEKHGFGVLLGRASGSSITMTGNLFAHIVERNPLSRAAELVFVNNLVYNRGTMDLDLQSEGGATTRNTVLNNVFVKGPSYARDTSALYVRTNGSLRLGSGSRVYQSGNVENYPRELLTLTGGETISGLLNLGTYPVWNGGLTARSTSNNAVYDRVLNYAGARPKDRDSVDKRIINHVKNRNGGVVNCVSSNGSSRCNRNAGGWPSYAQNRRTLTLPSNQSSIASNGYSNLENWLHSLDQQASGTMSTNSPTSPVSLSVQ